MQGINLIYNVIFYNYICIRTLSPMIQHASLHLAVFLFPNCLNSLFHRFICIINWAIHAYNTPNKLKYTWGKLSIMVRTWSLFWIKANFFNMIQFITIVYLCTLSIVVKSWWTESSRLWSRASLKACSCDIYKGQEHFYNTANDTCV